MSLFIESLDMPKSCRECRLLICEDISCDNSPYYCAVNQYLRWADWLEVPLDIISFGCPCVEVSKPHGDLIDRDALQQKADAEPCFWKGHIDELMVRDAPTIIEAED